jgi:hypothetical protein
MTHFMWDHHSGVMVKVLSLPVSFHCLEKQRDYKIGPYICCLFDMHTEIRSKNMDVFVRIYDDVVS